MKILLISGHGQGDPGACGCGYREADLTREISDKVKNYLSAYAQVDQFDQSIDCFQYLKKGNSFNFRNYDLVYEFHFNASNGQGHGAEAFITTSENGYTVEEKILANLAKIGFTNRGVKRENWLVINYIKRQGVSATLLEICFIDNQNDMNLYVARIEDVAKAIADGIIDGFRLRKNELVQPTKGKINYQAHVTGDGWLPWVKDGETAGTTGQSKQLEAIRIDADVDIEAKAHIANDGWIDYGKITKDTVIGSTGRGLQMEDLCLRGPIQFRVHIGGSGWTPWTNADGIATLGTVGQGRQIEAIEIKTI